MYSSFKSSPVNLNAERGAEILVDSALTHRCNNLGIYCRTKQPGTLRFDYALTFASDAAGNKKPSVVTYE